MAEGSGDAMGSYDSEHRVKSVARIALHGTVDAHAVVGYGAGLYGIAESALARAGVTASTADATIAAAVEDVAATQEQRLLDNLANSRTARRGGGFSDYAIREAVADTSSALRRVRSVAQRGFDYAVENPRVEGLNRMQLGKDAEVQATRWLRRWAERNGIDGIEFQVRGANSIPDIRIPRAQQIFDFKLTPKAVKRAQGLNFLNDFPGYAYDYIFGPGSWR